MRSTSTELAHAVLQVGRRDLRAELDGKVPLTGSARDLGVRGRQAPWVVTKEVGKRRRRSSADAAPETSPFCKFDRDLPRFLRISFSRSIFFSSDFLRPTGSWQRWDSEQRGTATGRQPLSLVQISSFPPGARAGGPGIAPRADPSDRLMRELTFWWWS